MTQAQAADLLDEFAAAAAASDRVALEMLLDEQFQFVSAHARVVGREQRLAALAGGATSLVRLEFDDRDVREVGDIAIVRARFVAEFRPDAEHVRINWGVSTFVFVRRGAYWRIYHQHNSHMGGG